MPETIPPASPRLNPALVHSQERAAYLRITCDGRHTTRLHDIIAATGDLYRLHSLRQESVAVPDCAPVFIRALPLDQIDAMLASAFGHFVSQNTFLFDLETPVPDEFFDDVLRGRDRIESFRVGFSRSALWARWPGSSIPHWQDFEDAVTALDAWIHRERTHHVLGFGDLKARLADRIIFAPAADDPQWLMRICAMR